ncbi:hypothetical protein D9M68_971620 [compost metagenome]
MQIFFYPVAQFAVHTAMMQGNGASQFGRYLQKGLIPQLTHTPCIDKDECGAACFNDRKYFMHQFNTQVPGPGIFFNFIRKHRQYVYLFAYLCAYDTAFLL